MSADPSVRQAMSHNAEVEALPPDETDEQTLVARAVAGGTQGVIQVAITAPHHQVRRSTHDQDHRDHQQ
jgi:hypothetical protein